MKETLYFRKLSSSCQYIVLYYYCIIVGQVNKRTKKFQVSRITPSVVGIFSDEMLALWVWAASPVTGLNVFLKAVKPTELVLDSVVL